MKDDADTVIVAASFAWGEYQKAHAYVSLPGSIVKCRCPGIVTHIGFYYNNRIYPLVATIIDKQTVPFKRGQRDQIGKIVDLFEPREGLTEPESYDFYVLSGPKDPETVDLGRSITNDLQSDGRRIAFTRTHRYVWLKDLKKVKRTSELIHARARSR